MGVQAEAQPADDDVGVAAHPFANARSSKSAPTVRSMSACAGAREDEQRRAAHVIRTRHGDPAQRVNVEPRNRR
ncbi:MAG: hypothetical protein ACJ72W_03260 [Actinoallomurus sp.]